MGLMAWMLSFKFELYDLRAVITRPTIRLKCLRETVSAALAVECVVCISK